MSAQETQETGRQAHGLGRRSTVSMMIYAFILSSRTDDDVESFGFGQVPHYHGCHCYYYAPRSNFILPGSLQRFVPDDNG